MPGPTAEEKGRALGSAGALPLTAVCQHSSLIFCTDILMAGITPLSGYCIGVLRGPRVMSMEHRGNVRPYYLRLCPTHHRDWVSPSSKTHCAFYEVAGHTIPSLLGHARLEMLIPGRRVSREM